MNVVNVEVQAYLMNVVFVMMIQAMTVFKIVVEFGEVMVAHVIQRLTYSFQKLLKVQVTINILRYITLLMHQFH